MSTQTQLAPLDGADQTAMSRQEAARQACEAAGIVWPGTILPPGTALYRAGTPASMALEKALAVN